MSLIIFLILMRVLVLRVILFNLGFKTAVSLLVKCVIGLCSYDSYVAECVWGGGEGGRTCSGRNWTQTHLLLKTISSRLLALPKAASP